MSYQINSENPKELLKRWALNSKRSQYANMESDLNNEYKILLALISVFSAVLASLQTFLNYSDRASRHRSASAEYGAIKRHIQELLTKKDITLKEISTIRENMNKLAKESPEVPGKFHKIATKEVPEIHLLTKQRNQ